MWGFQSNRDSGSHGVRRVAAACALAAAAIFTVQSALAADAYAFDAAKGQSLFLSTCAACHQSTGEGIAGVFPPLKGNAVVNDADPTAHLHTILFGAHALIIGGVKYASDMPPFGTQLSDAEVADIANHERTSWGNSAKQVTPAEVAAVRAKGK